MLRAGDVTLPKIDQVPTLMGLTFQQEETVNKNKRSHFKEVLKATQREMRSEGRVRQWGQMSALGKASNRKPPARQQALG